MDRFEAVRGFVIENFLFGEVGRIDDGTPFLESGIIDSTGILELVAFLEETYGIRIDDEEIVPENLNSMASIVRFLDGKLGALRKSLV